MATAAATEGSDAAYKCLIRQQGGPLAVTPASKPTTLEPNEVCIRLHAVAINPADGKMIRQGHRVTSYPFVPGLDGAGIIDAVGGQVRGEFAPGDRVTALFGAGERTGSYQSYAVLNEARVAKVPESWPFEEAASLSVSYYTAMGALGIGLETPLPFIDGGATTGFVPSSVLILGGSSALGAATIQLLRLAVPSCKIFTTSSPKHHGHLVDSLGVDVAFDRSSATLVEDIKAAAPGASGVDAIVDAVGAGSTERHIFDVLSPEGPKRYAQVWTGDDEITAPEGVDSVMFRSRDVHTIPGGKNVMQGLQTLLGQSKYKLPLPIKRVGQGLGALEEAVDLSVKGVSGEKLVIAL
ncbi:chaperonin 10-like protein [Xylariales sp. PMI_506]|nr:chaperonin 10-like protein [Xylariales sp. PMI_506]